MASLSAWLVVTTSDNMIWGNSQKQKAKKKKINLRNKVGKSFYRLKVCAAIRGVVGVHAHGHLGHDDTLRGGLHPAKR